MSGPDVLFPLRNNFYLGAFQAAINESNVRNLSEAEAIERDCLVYRSYIALGQCQVQEFCFYFFIFALRFFCDVFLVLFGLDLWSGGGYGFVFFRVCVFNQGG